VKDKLQDAHTPLKQRRGRAAVPGFECNFRNEKLGCASYLSKPTLQIEVEQNRQIEPALARTYKSHDARQNAALFGMGSK
jgi:hypothetical protein